MRHVLIPRRPLLVVESRHGIDLRVGFDPVDRPGTPSNSLLAVE
jgi:hypothetical protein